MMMDEGVVENTCLAVQFGSWNMENKEHRKLVKLCLELFNLIDG